MESVAMNGGEGPNSYFRNSKFQKTFLDDASVLLMNSIGELLDTENRSKIFSIADLGCSTGPNTFACVNNLIDAVKHKYSTQVGDNGEIPEFHVFFNDRVGNDFNTLFKALPSEGQYMAAGVPGSFYGRLFPKSSMNLIHSSSSLQWLQKVHNAFRNQFFSDLKDFMKARSEELVPGGLLAVLLFGRPEGTLAPEAITLIAIECIGDIVSDLVKEGVIGEDLVDSFNLPLFFPTLSEVQKVLDSFDQQLTIERFQEIHSPQLRADMRIASAHCRAVLERMISDQFGPKLTDEIFNRLPQKLQDLSVAASQYGNTNVVKLFLLLKRKDDRN